MKMALTIFLSASLTWLVIYLSEPVWVAQDSSGHVAVIGRIEGKQFNVIVFDKKFLDGPFTGLQIDDGRKPEKRSTPL